MLLRLFNMGLRMGSLGLKLVLTLYMGKYLGLTDLGTYGLVSAYVAILIPFAGMRLDYVVSRDIVDTDPEHLVHKLRDQFAFYGLNYVIMTVLALALMLLPIDGVNHKFIAITLGLSILESFAAVTNGNIVSLRRPILANALFFTRSSSWVIPVIALGLYDESFRNADTIFALWFVGIVLSLLATAYYWREFPWSKTLSVPIDWTWIKKSIRVTFLIWVGTVCAAGALYVDRFVVELYLDRDHVGIISFYGSFVTAIFALLNSGIFAFTYPILIGLHKKNATDQFRLETRKATIHAIYSALGLSLVIGVTIPLIGRFFDRPEFADNAMVLWMMLVGVCIRGTSEIFYYVMYARGQDKEIWISSLFALIAASGFNLVLVPIWGFTGVGISAIAASIVLSIFRYMCVRKYKEVQGAGT